MYDTPGLADKPKPRSSTATTCSTLSGKASVSRSHWLHDAPKPWTQTNDGEDEGSPLRVFSRHRWPSHLCQTSPFDLGPFADASNRWYSPNSTTSPNAVAVRSKKMGHPLPFVCVIGRAPPRRAREYASLTLRQPSASASEKAREAGSRYARRALG